MEIFVIAVISLGIWAGATFLIVRAAIESALERSGVAPAVRKAAGITKKQVETDLKLKRMGADIDD